MRQKRAYRYRCYPTPEQAGVLARTLGCARFVYNWALRLRTDAYYERQERVSYADTSAALTVLKRKPGTAWLNDVSSVPTQQALRHLDRAFRTFFEGRAKYPAFHKKHGAQAAEYTTSAFRWDAASKTLTLAKMDAPLPVRWSRPLPDGATPSTVTVSRDTAGRYFVSLLVEEEIAPLPPAPGAPAVGLDLGLQDAVVLHTGEKVGNPRFFHWDAKRLAKAQRRLAKKRLGSKSRAKARRKVARIHARITDRRRDFLHKLSTRLIRENQTICIESLQVKALVKRPTLAQAIHDVGWGEFVRLLTYKAAWYGRTLVAIDKWYPSSKRCSACGHVLGSLSLDTRQWTCPQCGSIHDRDVNAAKNVLAAGLAVSACGEAVRPGRVRPDSAHLAEAGIPTAKAVRSSQ
ncbi:MAG TPA: RNA-guided endonuclease TnpB family protein [Ktedonobacterales bacterium]|nr:RNA-guided endonuclease TnpB family protein [Ktedonobacterales bacterium]